MFDKLLRRRQKPAEVLLEVVPAEVVQEALTGALAASRPRPTEADLTETDWAILHMLKDAHCAPDSYVVLPSGLVLRADGLHWTTED